ncbi:MAG: glycoside hydrolase family 27 protein [Bacteroidales bacterium]
MKSKIRQFSTFNSFIGFILFIGFCSSCDETQKYDASSPLPLLAEKPPLGWNSWDCFSGDVNEEQVKAVADYMAEHLKEYGWEYVVIDGGWYNGSSIDEYGRFWPDTSKFPSAKNGAGFKPLADYIHSKGLKMGIHLMRGIPRLAVSEQLKIMGTQYTADEIAEPNNLCTWSQSRMGINMTHPAGQAYYESLAELFAEWEIDFIKADDMSSPYQVDEIEGLSTALRNSGRDILLSLSPGGSTPLGAASHIRRQAHMFRISGDFWENWDDLKTHFMLCERWAPYVTENHWPDADMLPIGKLRKTGAGEWEIKKINANSVEEATDEYSRFTQDEQITMMNLWSIFRSPLMIGGYLPENDDFTFSLITNKELLALNQESVNNKVIYNDENKSIWTADSQDGKYKYLAVFNISETLMEEEIILEQAGLDNQKEYLFEDIWSKEKEAVSGTLSLSLEPHASKLYRIEI